MTQFEKIVSLAKRRGFVYLGSEIYGGLPGTYDYGHYGTLLKNNIRDAWIRQMVQLRDDVYLLDSAIFMHPSTWLASGHVEGFDDPQIDCRNCNNRMRADHLLESFGVSADKASLTFINSELDKLRAEKKLICTSCRSSELTQAKKFSLMVKSNLGSPTDSLNEENVVYLRPETCGGIYLNYKNILDSLHPKLPFGIAQVGKAFRNEVTTRQFVFRTREFEQMEMQYFLHPKDMPRAYQNWKEARFQWYLDLGIRPETIRWFKHEKLAHYAREAYDIEYNFGSLGGFKEVEGVHTRGDWDLSQHAKFSGIALDYFDPETEERFVPHILETSVGLNRLVLMLLDSAYSEDEINGEPRLVMKFPKALAPVKVAVFPLLRNKPELIEKAQTLYKILRVDFVTEFDDNGNIGKRYRRQDEIGTPYCVTVDFETLENDTVTLRERDSAKQERIPIKDLSSHLKSILGHSF